MKKILKCIALGLFLFTGSVQAQQNYTLSGYVRDATNGESLIGATVIVEEISGGGVTNVYGFYSITLPEGDYTVQYRYVGFETTKKSITLNENIREDVELVPNNQQLEEVIVTSKRDDANVSEIEMSTAQLDIQTISKIPAFAGEVDIIKSIQLLPGVSSVGEGASGFNVRGGGVGQNLVLLDEAPVYQTSHLFGFFSVFNPDAVKDVKLYKGGIPARYGGRLSSILDIRMKEGNNKSYEASGGVGTVFSRFAVEGPIKKDKASFILAGRRSYADILIRPFTDVLDDGAALYFYDLTAKANFNINPKNRVYVSGYFGRDVFRFDATQGFDWGNQTGTIRWNHLFNEKFFSNFTAFFSDYDYGFSFGEDDLDNFNWDSRIITYDFKPEFTYFLNTRNELTFGGEALLYRFKPARVISTSDGETTDISLEEKKGFEGSLYIANDQKLSERVSLQYGLRFSSFLYLGEGTAYFFADTIPGERRAISGLETYDEWEVIESFANLEPRLAMRYQLDDYSSIKASYNRMNQYIHLISNTVAATPIDVWQPSTNNISPQQGDQVALGYFRNFNNNSIETSAEVYYKWTRNQVDYIDGADILINELLEGELLSGRGRAYGLELYLKKNTGRFNGWISYTLGKSELKVDGINFGQNEETREGDWYPTRFDQRHNLKITSNYKLSEKMTLSGIFSYISGTPTTFPSDRGLIQTYTFPILDNNRNNVRIPDYHRLDLSLTVDDILFKDPAKGQDYIVLSIYNVYARRNPFSIDFSQDIDGATPGEPIRTTSRQISILGSVLPAISYNFKF